MPSYKLARVHWYLGQTLLPEHFQAQEEALEAQLRLRASLSGMPATGVAALEWNPDLLAQGSLSISTLTVVMPHGQVVDVPGNARLESFSLEDVGEPEVTVYLHVLGRTRDAKGVALYKEDPPELTRVPHVLRLSSERVLEGPEQAVDSLRLATFRKDLEGVWQLAEEQVPPLLLVGPPLPGRPAAAAGRAAGAGPPAAARRRVGHLPARRPALQCPPGAVPGPAVASTAR